MLTDDRLSIPEMSWVIYKRLKKVLEIKINSDLFLKHYLLLQDVTLKGLHLETKGLMCRPDFPVEAVLLCSEGNWGALMKPHLRSCGRKPHDGREGKLKATLPDGRNIETDTFVDGKIKCRFKKLIKHLPWHNASHLCQVCLTFSVSPLESLAFFWKIN